MSSCCRHYTYVTNAAGLMATKPGQRVLGLFNPGNMSLEWTGALAMPYPGTGPQRCVENQRPGTEPSLAQMTTKALELLSAKTKGNKAGFFPRGGRTDASSRLRGASMLANRGPRPRHPCQGLHSTRLQLLERFEHAT